MSYVMRRVRNGYGAHASGGDFLALVDHDFVPPAPEPEYPSGLVVFTHDVSKAMRFNSAADVLVCWLMQSTTVPLRPDGEPNRPISGYTFLCEDIDE